MGSISLGPVGRGSSRLLNSVKHSNSKNRRRYVSPPNSVTSVSIPTASDPPHFSPGSYSIQPPPIRASAMTLDTPAAIDRLLRFLAVPGITGEEGAISREIATALKEVGIPADAIRSDDAKERIPV